MKTLKTIVLSLSIFLITSAFTYGKVIKPISVLSAESIELNISQFSKYLEDGNPHPAEGIYRTDDNRYLIAIIKNSEKSHDFIGVVISADNQYWNSGDIKFNFVVDADNKLEGLYYNSNGESFPVQFNLAEKGIESTLIKKVEINELKSWSLASK